MTKNIVSLTATERRHIQRVLQDLTNLRIDEIRAAHAEHVETLSHPLADPATAKERARIEKMISALNASVETKIQKIAETAADLQVTIAMSGYSPIRLFEVKSISAEAAETAEKKRQRGLARSRM